MRLTPEQREELCICAYTHEVRDPVDNSALVAGCDRYLDEVVTPFLALSLGQRVHPRRPEADHD